jgi:transcriptional regulator with XRE-family HTH domain
MDNVLSAGQRLRKIREQLGLVLRDVESASSEIARTHNNPEFSIMATRLSDIETKGVQPTIYRLYSLAVIYGMDFREMLLWYGIDFSLTGRDAQALRMERTHKVSRLLPEAVKVPVFDRGFDEKRTMNLGRMIQQWGMLPVAYLEQFSDARYTYAFIGTQDFTMFPMLMPGSIVQVDEAQTKIEAGPWSSEYERPLYLLESREGFVCCWCTLEDNRQLLLQSHPLSPVRPKSVHYPQEVEIVGRVIAVARRLEEPRQERRASLVDTASDAHFRRPN